MQAVRRSITRRLVLMFALAALATFALVGAALYNVLAAELTRHQDDDLNTNLQNMRYTIERVGDPERWLRVRAKMDTLTPADGSVRFWVQSDDARFEYGSAPQPAQRYRTLAATIGALDQRPAVRLLVGVDVGPFEQTLRAFVKALALLSLSAVALVMLLGYWIARVGLHPLQRLSNEAKALRPKGLSQRLQAARLPVELSDLADAFNGALDRLEGAYQQLEAFNADVAHELRTPLTNLIGGTQVALARPRPAPELRDALQSNLEELERLRSIINDMLFLARADQGEAADGLDEVVVAHEVAKTIEFFEFVLDESGSTVAVEGETEARASINVALFRRALSNLLQNAIEHSQPGSRLAVNIERRPDGLWIGVSNPGSTVNAGHLPRLFDRFYRVDASRHGDAEHHGHGLGLAIVKAVADMHGGAVAARSADGVTTVAFSVPAR